MVSYLDNEELSATLPDLLRLRSLKGFGGSRLRGRMDDEIADMQMPDLQGTSIPQPSIPEIPQTDPENFDVRANQINIGNNKETLNKLVHLRRFDPSAGSVQPEYVEPENIQPQEEHPGAIYMHAGRMPNISKGFEGPNPKEEATIPPPSSIYTHAGRMPNISPSNTAATPPKDTGLTYEQALWAKTQMNPNLLAMNPEYKAKVDQTLANAEETKLKNQKIKEAVDNPGKEAVPGATQLVMQDPIKRSAFEEILGQNIDDSIAEQLSKYENVLANANKSFDEVRATLDEYEQGIRDRIDSRQLTTQDKILMGIALIMPLIAAGLIGGKEALFGALSGGLSGVGQYFTGLESKNAEDQEEIKNTALKKADLAQRQLDTGLLPNKIEQDLRKNFPINERTEILKGRRRVIFETPDGTVSEGIEILPDFVIKNEFINDKEDKTKAIQSATELSSALKGVTELNKVTQDITEIASQLKDDPNLFGLMKKYVNAKLEQNSTKGIDFTPLTGQTVMFKGKPVNANVVLRQQLGLLTDAYRLMKGMRALTGTVSDHIETLFNNPATSFTTSQDLIDQMTSLRDLAQARLISESASLGFYPEFIARKMADSNLNFGNTLQKRENDKYFDQLMGGGK